MNNNYDRDLPAMELAAEKATSHQEAKNILTILRLQEQRRQVRAQAIRASYISPQDII